MLPDNYIPDSLEEASDLLNEAQQVMQTLPVPSSCHSMERTQKELEEWTVDRLQSVIRFLQGGQQ